ncbi:MAG: DUF1801 domain-containing protein [Actinomycetota bacterium]
MADPDVDHFFTTAETWRDEMLQLRQLALATGMTEVYKWKQPCYVQGGTNVAIISPFVNYCALSFFQGVLLGDHAGRLVAPGEDSQSSRSLRFTSVAEIDDLSEVISTYLREAMARADEGAKVAFPARHELELPDELVELFDEVDGLEEAFAALTPGRQRGFVLQIGGAKQSATRRSRAAKHVDRILAGKGIHDCICGRSSRMPRCDGSHATS